MADERPDSRGPGRVASGEAGRAAERAARAESLSDERLQRRVCERLTAAPDIDSSEIVVKVRNRDVTLEGEVPNPRMKEAAEACAAAVLGIEQVRNLLQPPPAPPDVDAPASSRDQA